MTKQETSRPNVVMIVADDLGFSDLACYGGEIRSPSLDRLARDGVRLSQFYNTARCSPSRASLLTGLHPHQTGVGILTNDDRPLGYSGSLDPRCMTMAEALRDAGYATFAVGKWHLASQMRMPSESWPTRRGFEHFFGTLSGCGSYYDPSTLTRGETNAEDEARNEAFFYTDAIADEGVRRLADHAANRPISPFFLYVAFTAPHWPLHAPDEDVAGYDGAFDVGWDTLRERRIRRLTEFGIVGSESPPSERDPGEPAWESATDRDWQLRRMQAYAAQVERMDRGIGRIVGELERIGRFDDTLLFFLSDNGASSEQLPLVALERFRRRDEILRLETREGNPVHIGNDPALVPGAEDTYQSYGRAWANLSNTPFRLYKRWVHEGGISTPCIVHWTRGGLAEGRVVHVPFQLTDVLPTVCEAAGIERSAGNSQGPMPQGRSMLPALRGAEVPDSALCWEHTGNAAIRRGRWKLVREYPGPWELYDMDIDRAELRDRASDHPHVVAELADSWRGWAEEVGVIPWERTLALYRERGLGAIEAAG